MQCSKSKACNDYEFMHPAKNVNLLVSACVSGRGRVYNLLGLLYYKASVYARKNSGR